jgi:hypothetical protein
VVVVFNDFRRGGGGLSSVMSGERWMLVFSDVRSGVGGLSSVM